MNWIYIITDNFSLVVADEEFDELCFEFGLELDEIVSDLFWLHKPKMPVYIW